MSSESQPPRTDVLPESYALRVTDGDGYWIYSKSYDCAVGCD